MNNFKVGDKVRCIKPADGIQYGDTFVVEEVDSDWIKILVNGELRFCFANRFQLDHEIGETVPFDELNNYIGWTVECRRWSTWGVTLTARGVLHIIESGSALTPENGYIGNRSCVFTLVSPPIDPDEDVLTLLDKWDATHAEPRKMSKVTLQKIRDLGLEVTVKDSE